MKQSDAEIKDMLLEAALPHVVFDGWGEDSFRLAIEETGIDPAIAALVCPRGAHDLAAAYHKRGDDLMVKEFAAMDLTDMRYRDKITGLVRLRLEVIGDKEIMRRGAALFALPQHASEGARLIWETADLIWNTLGDTSNDINWYTKRATLSGVYGSCALFWLGDESEGHAETWAFLDRRIENVMQFEKLKAGFRDGGLFKGFSAKAPKVNTPPAPGPWKPTGEAMK